MHVHVKGVPALDVRRGWVSSLSWAWASVGIVEGVVGKGRAPMGPA